VEPRGFVISRWREGIRDTHDDCCSERRAPVVDKLSTAGPRRWRLAVIVALRGRCLLDEPYMPTGSTITFDGFHEREAV
jgi:hypothetical protein